ncbi:tenascin-X-like [Leucoraja erinacea]|uniref:tenascin-X-like n=1 Tax=Leucoraja erinaceus TaxID=7782 RepID=UPI0024572133|nr:tenascin-X-like [Leucoraja erinacea]
MAPALGMLLLLLVAAVLPAADCVLFRTSVRQRRALSPNATGDGDPTTFDHIYTIELPPCRECRPSVARPLARLFEARDEAGGERQFEHLADRNKQVVFTHRINIPPQACGCEDGQALQRRLEALEKEVAALQRRCAGGDGSGTGCCGSRASSDCGAHGTLNAATCGCTCEPGWIGATCSEPACSADCSPPRGDCVSGHCVCRSGYTGNNCGDQACPDDCNDQGRCVDDRCQCFSGYTGPGCTQETCPGDCGDRGRCLGGQCVCKEGFGGRDCSHEIPMALRLRMKKILETKATVEWDLPQEKVDEWELTFRALKEEDGRLTHHLSGSKTTFQQSGLGSGQEYQVTLQARLDKSLSKVVSRTFTTMIDGPQNLHVVSATNSTIELGWRKPHAAIDRYRLNYSSATGRRSQKVVPAGDSRAVLTGLEAGMEHTISLVGERGQHRSKAVATTGTTVIDSPRSLRVVGVTDSTIGLQWDRSMARVDIYRIAYRSQAGRGGDIQVSGTHDRASLEQLDKGTKYTISLVAERGAAAKSQPVITTATTEGPGGREVAGDKTSPLLAANESQTIQDISKAISKRISSAGLSTNAGVMARSAIRRYSAIARKHLGPPRVMLSSWPPKPKLPSQLIDNDEKITGRGGSTTKAQDRSHVGTGRPGNPTGRVAGSPGSNSVSRRKIEHVGPPGTTTASRGKNTPRGAIPTPRGKNGGRTSQGRVPTSGGKAGGDGFPERVPSPGGRIDHDASPPTVPVSKPTSDNGRSPGSFPGSRANNGGGGSSVITLASEGKNDLAGSNPRSSGDHVSPSANIMQGPSPAGQGPGDLPQTGRSGADTLETPGENQAPTLRVSPRLSSKTHRPPAVAQVQKGSSQRKGLVLWTATSPGAEVSWQLAGGPFDALVLAYRDSLTKVVLGEVPIGGDQRKASITGLILGKSYDVYLSGISLDNPPQLVNVTTMTVRGTEDESVVVQAAGEGEGGNEEQEQDGDEDNEDDDDEEEGGQEEEEVEIAAPDPPEPTQPPVNLPTAGVTIEAPTLWSTSAPATDLYLTTHGFSTLETHLPGDLYPLELSTPAPDVNTQTDTTISIPPTAAGVAVLWDVATREVTARSLRLGWRVAGGSFDSVLVQYRPAGSSGRWMERSVRGRFQSVLLGGLAPGTRYSFRLYGIEGGRRTKPYSLVAATAALEKTRFGKADTLVVTDITDTSLRLVWTTDLQFDSFLVHYTVEGSKAVRKVKVTGDLRFTVISGLGAGTTYTLHLFGVTSGQRTKPLTTTATTDKASAGLGSLSASDPTANSARLTWTTLTTFDSYLIQYKVQGSEETQNVTVPGGKRWYLIAGLLPSTKYTIYIYGISGTKRTQPLTTHFTTAVSPAISALTVSNVTASSLRVWWESTGGYAWFLVEYRAVGPETRNVTVSGDLRHARITGLNPSTRYTITLHGVTDTGRSAPLTTEASTEVDPSEAMKLDTLTFSQVTAGSFRITWRAEKIFESFLVVYGVRGSDVTRNVSLTGDVRFAVVTGLRPGTAYTVRVYGVSASGQTKPLTTLITTKEVDPSEAMKLDTLTFSQVTTGSFRITWRAEKIFESFLVVYGVRGSDVTRNVSLTGDVRFAVVTGLRPGTAYTVRVYGVSASGQTKPLTTLITTKASTEVDPSEAMKLDTLTFSQVTTGSFRITWRAEKIFESFLVVYGVRGSDVTRNVSLTGDVRFAVVTGLQPGTAYTVRVYGVSTSGQTEPLTTLITTKASTEVDPSEAMKLDTLTFSQVTAGSFRITWRAEKIFESFLVVYGVRGSDVTRNVSLTGDVRFAVVTGLRPGTAYTVRVYGVSASGQTEPLTTLITTKASTEVDPSEAMKLDTLTFSQVTAGSFRITWRAEKIFESFLVVYGVRGSDVTRNVSLTGDVRFAVVTGLRPGTAYTVRVYGVSASGQTEPLTTLITTKASTEKVKLKRVISVLVSKVTAVSLRLAWKADRGFDAFLVRYKEHGKGATRNMTVPGDRRVVTIANLRPGTKYTVYIHGMSNGQRTKPISRVIATPAAEDKAAPAPARIGSLSASDPTASSARLTWTTLTTFDSYLIQYKVQGSEETQNVTVPGGKRWYLIAGLLPSTKYTIYIYGISGTKRTQPLTTHITTAAAEDKAAPAPARIGSLSASDPTASSARLTWTTLTTFDSYLIQYKVQGSEETQNVTVPGGKRWYLIAGLLPSTKYTIYIYGISGTKRTQPLTTHITTADPEEPATPARIGSLSPPKVTANSARLTWTTLTTFDSYLIQYKVQGSEETQNVTVPGGKRWYLIAGLLPSTKYTIYIYGISGTKRTQPLTTHFTTADPEEPATPARIGSLSPPKVTANSARLTWTTLTTFDSYLIQYKVQGSEETQNVTVPGGKRWYLIAGLLPSTKYTIYIYGISGTKRTQPLTTHITTAGSDSKLAKKPGELGTLSVSHMTPQSFKLSWTAARGFDSFLVEYSAAGVGGVSNLTVPSARSFSFVRGLTPATVYTVHVYGLAGGQRSKPLTKQVTTVSSRPEVTKPADLSGLSGRPMSPSEVSLSWEARRDFDSFVVQFRPQGSEDVRKVTVKGSSRAHMVSGLRPSSKYTFYLYGVTSGRHSAPISTTVVTTDATEPSSPPSLGVSDISADSLQFSWTVERVYQLFLVQYRAHGSFSFHNLTVNADKRSYSIMGLEPSTKYLVYLYGVYKMHLTKLMAFVATTTASTVKDVALPGQVRALGSLSVSNITADSLELWWSARWQFDSMVIQYRAQGSEGVRKIRLAGDRRSYLLLGLLPSTKYTIYIHGVSAARQSAPLSIVVSTTAAVDTNGVRPSRLSKLIRLSGDNVTDRSLQVYWAAESGFDSFIVQYGVDGATETRNLTAAGNTHSAFIAGLKPSTRYLVALYGVSGNRQTRPLTTVITTAASIRVEQVKSILFGGLTFSNITANSLQLSWEADDVFDSFLIQYVAQGSGSRANLTLGASRRSAYLTGLLPATNYTIYLHGVSGGKLSRPLVARLTITAVPVYDTLVSTLGGLLVSDISARGMRLAWTVEEGAFDSFLVSYRDSMARLAARELTVPGSSHHVTITDLSPSTEYQLSLHGVLDGRRTDPIPITARTARESPSGLRFTKVTESSVTISWSAGSDHADSYKIFYVQNKQGEPLSRSVDGTRTNVTLSSLAPGARYEVNLVPVRGGVELPPILGHFTHRGGGGVRVG